jgi:hypothetical protein
MASATFFQNPRIVAAFPTTPMMHSTATNEAPRRDGVDPFRQAFAIAKES